MTYTIVRGLCEIISAENRPWSVDNNAHVRGFLEKIRKCSRSSNWLWWKYISAIIFSQHLKTLGSRVLIEIQMCVANMSVGELLRVCQYKPVNGVLNFLQLLKQDILFCICEWISESVVANRREEMWFTCSNSRRSQFTRQCSRR
jgi:hypothetical protein